MKYYFFSEAIPLTAKSDGHSLLFYCTRTRCFNGIFASIITVFLGEKTRD
jgi:hypothetical protein